MKPLPYDPFRRSGLVVLSVCFYCREGHSMDVMSWKYIQQQSSQSPYARHCRNATFPVCRILVDETDTEQAVRGKHYGPNIYGQESCEGTVLWEESCMKIWRARSHVYNKFTKTRRPTRVQIQININSAFCQTVASASISREVLHAASVQGRRFGLICWSSSASTSFFQETTGKYNCLQRLRQVGGDTFAFWPSGHCQEQWERNKVIDDDQGSRAGAAFYRKLTPVHLACSHSSSNLFGKSEYGALCLTLTPVVQQ